MQNSIGTASHGYVKSHGIEESISCSDVTRQHALIAILVIGQCVLDDLSCSLLKEFNAVDMRGEDRTIAWKTKTNSLCQRVHGVGSKHSRAASATRTSTLLYLLQFVVAHLCVSTFNHCCDQVSVLSVPTSGFHRATRTEHCRDIKAHGCHEHARRDLITIGDADHSVSLMGIDHIFYGISDNITGRQ